MHVMQKPGSDLTYGTVPGAPHSDGKTFLVFIYIWHEDVANIPKVPEVLGKNMVGMHNHLLYHFSIETIHQFLRDKIILKNKLAIGEMQVEKNY